MNNTKITSREAILLLSHHPKIGAQSIKKLEYLCGGDFSRLFHDSGLPYHKINSKIGDYLREVREYNLEQILQKLSENNIGYVTCKDKEYPRMLCEVADCPSILFVKGDIALLNSTSIAVVGSRKYSPYGAKVCRMITTELTTNDLIIVSGLALGIDSIAHQATLDNAGKTIAVLGCGLDRIYPTSNSFMATKIIESGGAVISEYPPGTEAFKGNFPARNRIIASLTIGTVVVEAAKESGALITAFCALDYNREVFAVPGPIDSEFSAGCNHLIQQGAKLICSAQDIYCEINVEQKKLAQKAEKESPKTEKESELLKVINGQALSSDDICRQSGQNIALVSQTLTMLEMKGILENVGGIWRKK